MTGHPSSLPGAGGLSQPPVLWDPLVRITHWGVALVVVLNGLLVKPGGMAHLWAGWVALALLALRLIWGFVGPKPARFGTFLPDPVGAMRHLSGLLRGTRAKTPLTQSCRRADGLGAVGIACRGDRHRAGDDRWQDPDADGR